jgi:hypothetical protein
VNGNTELFLFVGTLHPSCRLTGGLNSWEQQRDENANNGDDYQKFNKSETVTIRKI